MNKKELTEEQQLAVYAPRDDNILLAAGAGTGKTTCLIQRVAYLHREYNIPLNKIICITFTNKAARELRMRLADLVGDNTEGDNINNAVLSGTFHSMAARIIRKNAATISLLLGRDVDQIQKNFTIMDEEDQLSALRASARDCLEDEYPGSKLKVNKDQIKRLLDEYNGQEKILQVDKDDIGMPMEGAYVDFLKKTNKQVSYGLYSSGNKGNKKFNEYNQDVYNDADNNCAEGDEINNIYIPAYRIIERLERRKRATQTMDYNDLIYTVVRAARINADFLPNADAVLADEYQDIDNAQAEFLKLLHENNNASFFAVGDADQLIYSWRGAVIANILNLQKRTNCRELKLTHNFRSTQPILDLANVAIVNNKQRIKKSLVSATNKGGMVPEYWDNDNAQAEAKRCINQLKYLKNKYKLKYSDFAILARTASALNAIDATIARARIPYRLTAGRKFAERAEIKDCASWLKLLINPNDNESCKRILAKPKRGIGDTSIGIIEKESRVNKAPMIDVIEACCLKQLVKGKAAKECMNTLKMYQHIINMAEERRNPEYILKEILKRSGILKNIQKTMDKKDLDEREEGEKRMERIQDLLDIARDNPDLVSFVDNLAINDTGRDVDKQNESVTVGTIHSAKGLEWDTVMIVGFEQGTLPIKSKGMEMGMNNSNDKAQGSYEEERRLLHVAATRAKNRLYLSRAGFRRGEITKISDFFSEIKNSINIK